LNFRKIITGCNFGKKAMKKFAIGLLTMSLLFSLEAEYRSIIFDIGGVILADDFISYLEQEFKNEEEVPYYLLEACRVQLWQDWNKGLVTQQELIDHLSLTYKRDDIIRLLNIFLNPDRPFIQETINIIQKLKEKGYKIYILSNLPKETYEVFVIQHSEFFKQFDGMCFSFQTGTVKPDHAIYDQIIEQYDLDPSECLFVDDVVSNIMGAQQRGIEGIVYKKGSLAQELHKFGIVTV
jgi:HAD superfamily hydrolase (TIGR01509 family)